MKFFVNFFKRFFSKLYTEVKKLGKYSKKDQEYWESIKDKYKGKRGFIIGNGPSLTIVDLEKLKGEITIASNRIYLIFDKVSWRPTIYTVADHILWPKIKDEVGSRFEIVHIPNYLDSSGIENTRYWRSPFSVGSQKFSDDLTIGAYGGHTVTFENIQIAMHLGLNPIYLIGCDHNYPGEKNIVPGVVIKQSDKQTHFVKNYRKPGEKVLPAAIDKMEKSYQVAKDEIEVSGKQIFNATRGGNLEIFSRVDLDKVLK